MKIPEFINSIREKAAGKFNAERPDYQFILNIIIIILINIAGTTLNARFDLTRDNTYSLSEKSREVVSGLNENLKIRVFFSKNLPAEHASIFRYLKDLLEEYDYYGNRYFSYEIVDEKDLEKEAADYGIRPVSSREFVDDQVKLRSTYMGLVIQHADLIEKVDSIVAPAGLEYRITSRIEKMTGKIDRLLQLKDPITVNLYLDSSVRMLPIEGIDRLEKQVSEVVTKSNVRNYNRLRFRMVNLSGAEESANIADLYGLPRLRWGSGTGPSGNRIRAGEGVLGIVLESGGKTETVDVKVAPTIFGSYVIQGIDRLEDMLSDAVGRLLNTNPVIVYITGHGEPDINDERSPSGCGLLREILSDMYTVRVIDLTKEDIPPEAGTIIVNGPVKEFTEQELFKIDQFLMQGKSGLFFVDSFREIRMQGGQNMFGKQPIVLPLNTGIEKLLAGYGVNVNRDIVLDKNCAKVNLGNMIRDYPLVPIITRSGLNRDSVVTRYLKGAAFIKSSSVGLDPEKTGSGGLVSRELVRTSDESWLMKGRINFNPMLMGAGNEDDMRSHTLAVMLSGTFDSYFRDRNIPVDGAGKSGKPVGKKSLINRSKIYRTPGSARTEIIVVGSSEITRSGFIMNAKRILSQSMAGQGEVFSNTLLLHGMVDYLAGNYYVPEMKSKSLSYNPLDKTGTNTRFIIKTANVAGIPLLVVLAGLLVWRRRISRRKRIMADFNREGGNE